MRTAASWFWLLYGLWVAVLAARLFNLGRWPWFWLLAPAWAIPLGLVAFAVIAYALAAGIEGFLQVREFYLSRKRMRLWKRIQHDGLRNFFIGREQRMSRRVKSYFPPRIPRKNGQNLH